MLSPYMVFLWLDPTYRTRAIISRGLYIFLPISKDHLRTVTFGLMYGLNSRAAYDVARTVHVIVKKMARNSGKMAIIQLLFFCELAKSQCGL